MASRASLVALLRPASRRATEIERVDGSGHLLGVAMHGFEAGAVVTAASLSVQRELGLGSDSRERRSQLVGELRGEALLMSDAGGQTLEESVERGSELGELVVRFATVEALVEIVVAPGGRVLGHAGDGQQGLAEDPVRQQGDGAEQEHGQRDRADERDRRCLVVGVERDAGDHGADPLSVVQDGEGVQPDLLLDTHGALRTVCQGPGECIERRARRVESRAGASRRTPRPGSRS